MANEVELPFEHVIVKKLASTHNNVPKICQGYLHSNPIKLGQGLMVGGDLGMHSTAVLEIELLEDGGIKCTTRNSTYVIYNSEDFHKSNKITPSDLY